MKATEFTYEAIRKLPDSHRKDFLAKLAETALKWEGHTLTITAAHPAFDSSNPAALPEFGIEVINDNNHGLTIYLRAVDNGTSYGFHS